MEAEAPKCSTYLSNHNARLAGSGIIVQEPAGVGKVDPKTGLLENSGKMRPVEICGRAMEVLNETVIDGNTVRWWYCPSCDRRDVPETLPEDDAPATV